MIEFPSMLIDYVDLPIGSNAPHRRAARSLVGEQVPVRVGASRMLAEVREVIFYPDSIEVWVYLPVITVALPRETELA